MQKLRQYILSCLLICWVPCLACAQTDVIIDTDLGMDDIMAIAYLSQQPSLHIKAITLSGTAPIHCPVGALRLTALLQRLNVAIPPISCNNTVSLSSVKHIPATLRRAADEFWRLSLPHIRTPRPHPNGAHLIQQILATTSQPITFVELGPATHLAIALSQQPSLRMRLAKIVMLGGSLHVPGNVASLLPEYRDNQVAEWNVFMDPKALQILLASGVPVYLVPLDVSQQIPLSLAFHQPLPRTTPAATLVTDLLSANANALRDRGWYFWDPLAAVLTVEPQLAHWKTTKIQVLLFPRERQGQLVQDTGGYTVQLATNVDKNRILQHYRKTLTQQGSQHG